MIVMIACTHTQNNNNNNTYTHTKNLVGSGLRTVGKGGGVAIRWKEKQRMDKKTAQKVCNL